MIKFKLKCKGTFSTCNIDSVLGSDERWLVGSVVEVARFYWNSPKFGKKSPKLDGVWLDLVKISLDLVKISLDLAGFGWILLDHIVILPKFMYMISWVGSPALVIGGKDP